MHKFKEFYKDNPFYFVFLGIIFIRCFTGTFIELVRRVHTLTQAKVVSYFKMELFLESSLELAKFITIAICIYLVIKTFSKLTNSVLKQVICLILIICFSYVIFYLFKYTIDLTRFYIFYPEKVAKGDPEHHLFIRNWFTTMPLLMSWNNFWYESFLNLSIAFDLITYALFISFLKNEQLTILTRSFLDKVRVYDVKFHEQKGTADNTSNKSMLFDYDQDSKNSIESVDLIEVFIAKKLNKEFFISVNEIISIHSDGNYVELITYDDSFLIRATLKNLLPQLPDFYMKIHRSALININQVNDIKIDNEDRKMYAIMKNNTEISISRSNQKEFKMKWARNKA